MKIVFFIAGLFLITSYNSFSQDLDYSSYSNLLAKYVSATGVVNYTNLKKSKSDLDHIVLYFADHPIAKSAARMERLAYWINVYNANTLKLVIGLYPIKSILEINNGKPWDLKIVKSGKEVYSLNQIENEIIRPEFKDARIHFALNCAAVSCPPLLDKAYTAADLDQILDMRTKSFITSMPNSIAVSKIFEWYKNDFGDVINFINKYADIKLAANTRLTYSEYNWSLNLK